MDHLYLDRNINTITFVFILCLKGSICEYQHPVNVSDSQRLTIRGKQGLVPL